MMEDGGNFGVQMLDNGGGERVKNLWEFRARESFNAYQQRSEAPSKPVRSGSFGS